jgi:tRNA pseudouridine55 synthase
VLLVDKPGGPTSHDIVDAIRRRFAFPKVGHGGTLDPQATGLLILLLGRATKLADQFTSSDKAYEGTIMLGVSTDSYDADGRVVREADSSSVTREQLEERMRAMVGDLMQAPPMVSAVKIDGVPLYKLARRGQTVERKPRLVHIYELALKSFEPPVAAFSVRCTKGTYVRSICADIGDALGCGAHLRSLRRTQCGAFSVNDAMPLDALLSLTTDALQARIVTLRMLALNGVI